MESIFDKCECGFRKGKSIIDQIQSMRQILEKPRSTESARFTCSSTSGRPMIP
jgi:hypothetical protein